MSSMFIKIQQCRERYSLSSRIDTRKQFYECKRFAISHVLSQFFAHTIKN